MAERSQTGVGDRVMFAVVFGVAGLFGLLWLGAAASAVLSGHGAPPPHPASLVQALRHGGDPSAAWGQPVGPPGLYWSATIMVFLFAVVLTIGVALAMRRSAQARAVDPRLADGVASRREAATAAGEKALLGKGKVLRPSLARPHARDLGYRLGRCNGVACWASVEDSIVVVGPPRSGKGLHLVVPAILDAPGAVITTSTRPDNLTATLSARSERGPVAVFDPQRLAPGAPNVARWSPARGCADPQTAMIRARALTAGAASGTSESSFWQASAEQAVRCLLHAAALSGRPAADLYRWSLSAVLAAEASATLAEHPGAAPGWANALSAILSADAKQRDSVWAMVGIAFTCLADPRVLESVSPAAGEEFDPESFLRSSGSLYLLGTSSGAGATAGLVGALIEDVVETARRVAAGSPGGRLDPPLSLILDEAANYRLPSLTALMSEGGGSGISTLVVLQSLAQARAVWGDHEGAALWDSAIVKVLLGGGSNARDLEDLSKLIGTRKDRQVSHSVGADGRSSRSTSTQDVPVLEPGRLRQLPFGTAVLMLRSARPIILEMDRWVDRPDAARLAAAQADLQAAIRAAHAETSPVGMG